MAYALSRLQQREADLAQAHTELADLTQELGRIRAEHDALAKHAASLAEHAQAAGEDAPAAHRMPRPGHDAELLQLRCELGALSAENERFRADRSVILTRARRIEEHNRLLTEAATERAQRVQDQEGQLASLHTEIATLTPEVTRLNGKNNFYARRVAELEEHNRLLTEAATVRRPRAQVAVRQPSCIALAAGPC